MTPHPRRLADAVLKRSMANQRAFVQDPRGRGRRVVALGIAGLLTMLAAVVINSFFNDLAGPYGVIAAALLAWFAGQGSLYGITRASAYELGWLEGRGTMLAAYAEARRRGLDEHDWLTGELERDGFLPPDCEGGR